MPNVLDDANWRTLLFYISLGKCTPFLGAGATCPALPLGNKIALKWAETDGYPLEDRDNLQKVAQFVAVKQDNWVYPKDRLAEDFKRFPKPDFRNPDEPHMVLAGLPLPIYITTNYDDFMELALKESLRSRPAKKPVRIICHWEPEFDRTRRKLWKAREYTPEEPLVFHLHGHMDEPRSMVLTEDDYVDFLVQMIQDFHAMIPPRVQEAFTNSMLLFLGYKLEDWDFKTLFRGLSGNVAKSATQTMVSVQLLPSVRLRPGQEMTLEQQQEQERAIQSFLDKYYEHLRVRVFWGTCEEFMRQLRSRWEAFQRGSREQSGGGAAPSGERS